MNSNSISKKGFFKLSSADAIFVILQIVVYAVCFTPLIMTHTVAGLNLCGWVIGIFPVIVALYSLIRALVTRGENRN